MSLYPTVHLSSKLYTQNTRYTRTLTITLTIIKKKKFQATFYASLYKFTRGLYAFTNLCHCTQHKHLFSELQSQCSFFIQLLGGLCRYRYGSGEVFLFLFLLCKIFFHSRARPPSLNTHHKARLRQTNEIFRRKYKQQNPHHIPNTVYCFNMALLQHILVDMYTDEDDCTILKRNQNFSLINIIITMCLYHTYIGIYANIHKICI